MKNIDNAIQRNNQLRKQLFPDNKKYYEDLMLYLRTKTLFKNEEQLEMTLLEILQDLLEAQAKGMSSEDYFGKNPQDYADDIIGDLSNDPLASIRLLCSSIGSFVFAALMPALLLPNQAFDLGALGLSGLYSLCFVVLIFYLISSDIYSSGKKIRQIVATLAVSLAALPIFLILFLVKTPFKITLQGGLGIVVILLLAAIESIRYYRKQDRKFWRTQHWVFLIFGLCDILTRLPVVGQYLIDDSTGRIYLICAITILLILLWLGTAITRHKKSHNATQQSEL